MIALSHLSMEQKTDWKLDWDSPLHLKRLAKELNSEGWQSAKAFYCRLEPLKFNQARFSKGKLQIRMCRGEWITVESEILFHDGNGNEISASRIKGKIPSVFNCPDCGKLIAAIFPVHRCKRA